MSKAFLFIGTFACWIAVSGCGEEKKAAAAKQADLKETNAPVATATSPLFTSKDYAIKGVGTLHLTVPKGWKDSSRQVLQAGRPVEIIEFSPANGNEFGVMLEILNAGEDTTKN